MEINEKRTWTRPNQRRKAGLRFFVMFLIGVITAAIAFGASARARFIISFVGECVGGHAVKRPPISSLRRVGIGMSVQHLADWKFTLIGDKMRKFVIWVSQLLLHRLIAMYRRGRVVSFF